MTETTQVNGRVETFTEIENNSGEGEGEGDKYGSSGRGENEKLESFLDPK